MLEILKAIILGIVEGVTEWLPISSTGHMILVDEFIHLNVTPEFKEMFLVVIQLGAILAVVVMFWKKLWPFGWKEKKLEIKKPIFSMWFKVIVSCIPAAVVGLLLDEKLNEWFYNWQTVSIMLILACSPALPARAQQSSARWRSAFRARSPRNIPSSWRCRLCSARAH